MNIAQRHRLVVQLFYHYDYCAFCFVVLHAALRGDTYYFFRRGTPAPKALCMVPYYPDDGLKPRTERAPPRVSLCIKCTDTMAAALATRITTERDTGTTTKHSVRISLDDRGRGGRGCSLYYVRRRQGKGRTRHARTTVHAKRARDDERDLVGSHDRTGNSTRRERDGRHR